MPLWVALTSFFFDKKWQFHVSISGLFEHIDKHEKIFEVWILESWSSKTRRLRFKISILMRSNFPRPFIFTLLWFRHFCFLINKFLTVPIRSIFVAFLTFDRNIEWVIEIPECVKKKYSWFAFEPIFIYSNSEKILNKIAGYSWKNELNSKKVEYLKES